MQAKHGKAPVYIDTFTRKHPYAPGVKIADQNPATVGAYHTDQLRYVPGDPPTLSGAVDCFEFDGGQPAQAYLPASAVVGAFDPGDDGNAQLLAGVPASAVQDVLLQQAEEGLHGRVVTGGPDTAH